MNIEFEDFYEKMKEQNVAVAEQQKEIYQMFFEEGQKNKEK